MKCLKEEIFQKALDCVRCGSCRVIYADRIQSLQFGKQCPSGSYHLIESFYPAGLMYLAVGLMRKQFPFTKRGVEAIYACTLCHYCQTICEGYVEAKTIPVIETLRHKAVKEGVGPLSGQKGLIENLMKVENILGILPERRGDWLKKVPKTGRYLDKGEKVSTLYFLGCQYSSDPSLTEVPQAAAELFGITNIEWGFLGMKEKCCGYPALMLGYPEIFIKFVEENVVLFNNLGIKKIITSCPECYSTFKFRYPEVVNFDIEIVHITELFYHLLKEKRIKFKESRGKVTYHDPCHLGRYSFLYEEPRELIKAIPGKELLEMERNRMDAWCCGAGGGVRWGNYEYAQATASERLEEALATGSEVLISSCPNCLQILREVANKRRYRIQIKDITNLLRESLGD